MDAERFDTLLHSFASGRSRRSVGLVLASFVGTALGLVAPPESEARKQHRRRRKHRQNQPPPPAAPNCAVAGCPSGLVCLNGGCFRTCTDGETCTRSIDCQLEDGSCVCHTRPGDVTIICADISGKLSDCATIRACTNDSECPLGQVCANIPGCCPGLTAVCRIPCTT
jgi:hypothetical protein